MRWKKQILFNICILFLFLIPLIPATEYQSGQDVKLWIQLLNSSGSEINDGVCFIDIYSPNNEEYLERATMTNFNHDGIYYYDFIAPLQLGTYPVISICYYIAGQISFFPNSYSILNGTLNVGTILSLQAIENNLVGSLRINEEIITPRRVQVVVNFSRNNYCYNSSSLLLTGITLRVVGRFDSVINDDITISIWNHTSNSWLDFPNKMLEGTTWKDVSNSLSFNNISIAGLVNKSGGDVRIKFIDTGLTDGVIDDLQLDYMTFSCDELSNSEWQEVRGSSEFHVSSDSDYPFYVETLCGSNENNRDVSSCSLFLNNQSYWNFSWGYLLENISFINSHQTNIDSHYHYETSNGQDCTSIIEIIEERNGSFIDLTSLVILEGGTQENCIITIPVLFNESQRDFRVFIFEDNYLKWENERIRDFMLYYKDYLNPFCDSIADNYNYSYVVPIDGMDIFSIYNDKPDFLMCYRIKDDLYFFDYFFNVSLGITESGVYESYIFKLRFYYNDLKDISQNLIQIDMTNYTLIYDILNSIMNNQSFIIENLDVEILPMTFSYSLLSSSELNITMSVNSYPYVDLNTSYTITLIPLDSNVFNMSIYLTELDGNISSYNFTWDGTNYILTLTFLEIGDYYFVINSSQTIGKIEGLFLVREPFDVTVCGYYDKTAKKYKNEFADLTAELTGQRSFGYDRSLEQFLSPLYSSLIVRTPVFHANYRNGCSTLKLYESNQQYAIRMIDGIIEYPYTYSQPNITKSYGSNIYLGNYYFNGSSQNLNLFLSDKDLHPFRWLFNISYVFLIILFIGISISLIFLTPEFPMLAVFLGIGGVVMLSVLRFIIWIWWY